MVWNDASFHDVIAVLLGAQRVVIERLDPDEPLSGTNPLIPKIKEDGKLRSLAKLLLARDTQAAVEAFIPWDLTPEANGGRVGHGWAHWVYPETRGNESYDIRAALNQADPPPLTSGGAAYEYFYMYELDIQYRVARGGTCIALRHTCGASRPRAANGQHRTSAETKSLAAAIYAASLAQTASDVAIDAGLAAQITANLAATRAAYLAQSQAKYPDLGFI